MTEFEFMPPLADAEGNQEFIEPETAWDHIDIAMVRNRYKWVVPELTGHRLQLGAGRKLIAEWDNLDFPEWDAHSSLRGRWRLPYEDATVSEVVSYHTLDHLQPWAVVRTLAEIQRVLVPGGVFTNIVPHYMSQLANECIMHHSRFAVDTFRNIFSERQYSHRADGEQVDWDLEVASNFIFGYTERNLVLVTQLVKQ